MVRGNGRATIPLYLLFFVCGICCVLPGTLSPALIQRWGMTDRHVGWFFLAFWSGSSLGALAVRGRLFVWTAVGSVAVSLGAFLLAFSPASFAPGCVAIFGAGLGMVLTAISITCQQGVADRRAELVRLNLSWAAGAFACPTLVARALGTGRTGPVFLAAGWFFAMAAVWCAFLQPRGPSISRKSGFRRGSWRELGKLPISLVIATPLSTGVEAAAGAWLATYAQREQHTLLITVAAPTCLWAGLMASRILESLPFGEAHSRRMLPVLLVAVFAGAFTILLFPAGTLLLFGALILGAGLGPLYPTLLARVMGTNEGAPVFFLAGVASALMPWMTGVLSTRFGSIRAGLAVPAGGAALMLLLGLMLLFSGSSAQAHPSAVNETGGTGC